MPKRGPGWVGGWVGGWVDGWMRLCYSGWENVPPMAFERTRRLAMEPWSTPCCSGVTPVTNADMRPGPLRLATICCFCLERWVEGWMDE